MRLKMVLAYDGRAFCGWQSQPDGRAVQDVLERAVAKVTDRPLRVHGAGRTDTGVHALAQVAHINLPDDAKPMTPDVWRRALNANLPPSLRVMLVEPVADEFHSRFSATGKEYHYRIWRGDVLPPLEAGLAWHVFGPLDLEIIQAALAMLVGTHNFARLSAYRHDPRELANRGDPEATTRTIRQAEAISDFKFRISNLKASESDPSPDSGNPQSLTLVFRGDGFLYKMVRLITGSLVHLGRGRANLDWWRNLLEQPEGLKSHHCAPADGLYLVNVEYEKAKD